MTTLSIKDKRIVISVVLRDFLGDIDLKDYLRENLPDARCSFAIGLSDSNGSCDEYTVTIDAVQEPILLLILRDFCGKNGLTHPIDIID